MRRITLASIMSLLLALSACGVLPQQPPPRQAYDFGPLSSKLSHSELHLSNDLVLDSVDAVPWLGGTDIHYRFVFDEPQQLHSYARSRWIAPPAVMLRDRLDDVFARAVGTNELTPADAVHLSITLERFEQVFDTPKHARAVLRVRATLSSAGTREAVAQRVFHLDQATPTADASGAVKALSALVDTLIQRLAEWVDKVQPKTSSAHGS